MIIVDTGVLYALADRDDAHHAASVRWLASARGPLLVPPPGIAEACYLIGRHLGPKGEAAFLDAVGPGQAFTLGTLLETDITRMAALVRQYADLPLGDADCTAGHGWHGTAPGLVCPGAAESFVSSAPSRRAGPG